MERLFVWACLNKGHEIVEADDVQQETTASFKEIWKQLQARSCENEICVFLNYFFPCHMGAAHQIESSSILLHKWHAELQCFVWNLIRPQLVELLYLRWRVSNWAWKKERKVYRNSPEWKQSFEAMKHEWGGKKSLSFHIFTLTSVSIAVSASGIWKFGWKDSDR